MRINGKDRCHGVDDLAQHFRDIQAKTEMVVIDLNQLSPDNNIKEGSFGFYIDECGSRANQKRGGLDQDSKLRRNLRLARERLGRADWLVPTIVVTQPGALEFYHKIGSPPWYLERVRITGADHWAMLQNAIRMGVLIALGTDQFPFEPNDGTTATIAEAELYVKAGMTPLQALQSATTQAAKMLAMDADLGTITQGKYADIVALDADPIKDIHALRTIDFVMKGGAVVRDDGRGIAAY
jgi:imidazolonepropionase-like amidohydrolase